MSAPIKNGSRAEVLVAPEHNLDGITPARLFGGRVAIFLGSVRPKLTYSFFPI